MLFVTSKFYLNEGCHSFIFVSHCVISIHELATFLHWIYEYNKNLLNRRLQVKAKYEDIYSSKIKRNFYFITNRWLKILRIAIPCFLTNNGGHVVTVVTIEEEHEQHQHHCQGLGVVQGVEPEERRQQNDAHRGGQARPLACLRTDLRSEHAENRRLALSDPMYSILFYLTQSSLLYIQIFLGN